MQKHISRAASAILVTSPTALSQYSISLVIRCETTYNTACGISNGTVAAEKAAGGWNLEVSLMIYRNSIVYDLRVGFSDCVNVTARNLVEIFLQNIILRLKTSFTSLENLSIRIHLDKSAIVMKKRLLRSFFCPKIYSFKVRVKANGHYFPKMHRNRVTNTNVLFLQVVLVCNTTTHQHQNKIPIIPCNYSQVKKSVIGPGRMKEWRFPRSRGNGIHHELVGQSGAQTVFSTLYRNISSFPYKRRPRIRSHSTKRRSWWRRRGGGGRGGGDGEGGGGG
ncbi:hypothetical protein M0804_003483 [Polistes exclamans]|nr:hypothetical protein M0804_003483 [Polistes exclamans]